MCPKGWKKKADTRSAKQASNPTTKTTRWRVENSRHPQGQNPRMAWIPITVMPRVANIIRTRTTFRTIFIA